jgi:hypothetical protein
MEPTHPDGLCDHVAAARGSFVALGRRVKNWGHYDDEQGNRPSLLR